jgi:exonuclease III
MRPEDEIESPAGDEPEDEQSVEDEALEEDTNNEETEEEENAPETVPKLRLATLNILDGRNNRLNAALRCMKQMNVDVGILTETKFHNNMFTKNAEGYGVVGTITTSNTGGVALIHRNSKHWGLESTKTFGPNVVRTTLVSGQRRWYIIGVYIPPSDETGTTLDFLSEAYRSVPNPTWPVIVMGDVNMDMQNPAGNNAAGEGRRLETEALLSTWGMHSMADHFRQRTRRIGRRWTWQRILEGVMNCSVCDLISTDRRQYFTNCQIKIPRYDTDHKIVLATLRVSSVKKTSTICTKA